MSQGQVDDAIRRHLDYPPSDVDELINTAMSHVTDDGWGDYISRGGAFEGQYTDPTFWDKLAILKDLEIPQEKRNNFFSCAC